MHFKILTFLFLTTFVFLLIYSKLIYQDGNNIRNKILLRSESNCECNNDKKIYIIRQNNSFQILFEKGQTKQMESIETYDISKLNEMNLTCNLYNVLRRGKNQKVIGYSLYGKNEKYYINLKNITQQVKKLYPGWTIRIYHDNSIKKSIICEIECLKEPDNSLTDIVDFCHINKLPQSFFGNKKWSASYIHSMAWRWLPLGDSFVNVFASRDLDSIIIQREVDSVNVWLNSKKPGHIMRDNRAHGTLILGGMWGFNSQLDRKLSKEIFRRILDRKESIKYNLGSRKGYDQYFLSNNVYPLIKRNSLIHDSYFCRLFKDSQPFPTRRKGNCFVGNHLCNENIIIFPDCPLQCRLVKHLDWKQC